MAMPASRRAITAGLIAAAPAAACISWVARDTKSFAQAGAAIRTPLNLSAKGDARGFELVRFTTLAPNSYNTQAWRFTGGPDHITVTPDPDRATLFVDPDAHHSFVSLGAAVETIAIAASAFCVLARPACDPASRSVRIDLTSHGKKSSLLAAVTRRQSNRNTYDSTHLVASERATLIQAAEASETTLHLVDDPSDKAALRHMVITGNATQIGDPAFSAELLQLLRFSGAEALAQMAGLFAGCFGNPAMPQWLGTRVFPLVFKEKSETAKTDYSDQQFTRPRPFGQRRRRPAADFLT